MSLAHPHSAPIAWILSQGDEVITGQIADTNAAFLSDRLTDLGFHVARHVSVGDDLEDIRTALCEIAPRAEVCLCTGGLGPTDDDLTARAVARAFDRPLEFDSEAMRQIEEMFARHQRAMPEINRRQAWLPRGASRLDNAWGTAPGFLLQESRCTFVFMPGVPREMKPMFGETVEPRLRSQFDVKPGRLVTLRTTGVGESEVQTRVGAIELPGVRLGTRTVLPENHVKLRFDPSIPDEEIRRLTEELVGRIGSPVFAVEGLGEPGGTLAEVVGRALLLRQETLSVAESCTGGRIAAACTGIPGSSRWFFEGVVSYSNAAKIRMLGVLPELLRTHGAVSEAVVRQMATGLRERSGTTYTLAVTGIAGPDGGTAEKPVGMVHLALATPEAVHYRLIRLGGDRIRIQELATGAALDLLRRLLQDKL